MMLPESYTFTNGWTAKREEYTSENGNHYRMIWVLRNELGGVVDFDQYRNDLFPRYNLVRVGDPL